MLQTLLKIGKWQSKGRNEWYRFLDLPEPELEDNRGNVIKNYTLPIILDLDKEEVIISQDNLEEYDESKVQEFIPIKLKGRRSKKIATALPGDKLVQMYNSFYGKEGKETEQGDLYDAIKKSAPKLLKEELSFLLNKVFKLKDEFISLTTNEERKGIDIRVIEDRFELSKSENIVFVYTQIISSQFNFDKPTPFSKVEPYKEFLQKEYFGEAKKQQEDAIQKLCYADGEVQEDVKELNLTERYSLNKMFVTETKNYASLFEENRFQLNYQVSAENQNYLDFASNYLLRQGYTVKIANVDHIIIPEFQSQVDIDLEMALTSINKKSDLLFNMKRLKDFNLDIADELKEGEVYWLNFMAFESDGNFFKTTEIIKDVSNFHFNTVIDAFYEIDKQFKKASFVDWRNIMTNYDFETKKREYHYFNFNSLFKIIPVRKNKEKKNGALELFKTILENRKVDVNLLYDYFTELILCHYYERYKSYTSVNDYSQNGKKSTSDYFVWACRDAVFKYHAFIQFLKELKLITMEEITPEPEVATSDNKYEAAISSFFTEMQLSENQKAMFYLGRLLNRVEYLQEGKNMTVIQKVNFNGMDKDDIQRLRIDLMEKAKQYQSINKVIFIDNKFGKYFNYNEWDMNPNEAIFFLLTGYSFGIGIKNKQEKIATENL